MARRWRSAAMAVLFEGAARRIHDNCWSRPLSAASSDLTLASPSLNDFAWACNTVFSAFGSFDEPWVLKNFPKAVSTLDWWVRAVCNACSAPVTWLAATAGPTPRRTTASRMTPAIA